eukprot:CAMPEP_0194774742 /NCGR_PEP_ID=MMETSP0323_2-20130528/58406_1 /TAXON_ID=2866 ORGANISM="Crypthecodinium cohnii, Strain Seligo" /NCGR_SAMPLE_ID=MMETSP0323_2 /ASSEMBLY_ACC=CAM_ASM_000346 /LENGTH=86 /DNA_ID=CAMNT_0039710401 /DNA_START=1 /DNA_END=258 /DNA_ORIENTATION=+
MDREGLLQDQRARPTEPAAAGTNEFRIQDQHQRRGWAATGQSGIGLGGSQPRGFDEAHRRAYQEEYRRALRPAVVPDVHVAPVAPG